MRDAPSGTLVASLHRKRLGAQEPERRGERGAEAFSIRRLEGSRWRLRRTLAMGIGWRLVPVYLHGHREYNKASRRNQVAALGDIAVRVSTIHLGNPRAGIGHTSSLTCVARSEEHTSELQSLRH